MAYKGICFSVVLVTWSWCMSGPYHQAQCITRLSRRRWNEPRYQAYVSVQRGLPTIEVLACFTKLLVLDIGQIGWSWLTQLASGSNVESAPRRTTRAKLWSTWHWDSLIPVVARMKLLRQYSAWTRTLIDRFQTWCVCSALSWNSIFTLLCVDTQKQDSNSTRF